MGYRDPGVTGRPDKDDRQGSDAGLNGSYAGHSDDGYRVEESDQSRYYSPHLRSILSLTFMFMSPTAACLI